MQSNNLIDAFKRELLENNRVSNILQNQTLHKSIENKKLRDRVKKLENDIKLMNITSADTKNSATVSNFQSSLAINLENVTLLEKKSLQRLQRNDSRVKELERKLENLEKTNSFLIRTATKQESNNEELRAADKEKIKNLTEKNQNLLVELEKAESDALNVHNNAIKNCSQCSKNVEEVESMRMANQLLENELGQCTEEIEELKNTIARKEKEMDAKKCDNDRLESATKATTDLNKIRSTDEQQAEKIATWEEKKFIRAPIETVDAGMKKYILIIDFVVNVWKDTVECMTSNTNNLSNPQNVSLYHKEMFILITDIALETRSNANLLSICRNWKKLRPSGEIHVLKNNFFGSAICPTELKPLFTTYNMFEAYPQSASLAKAISQCWPKYADQLLLPEYLN